MKQIKTIWLLAVLCFILVGCKQPTTTDFKNDDSFTEETATEEVNHNFTEDETAAEENNEEDHTARHTDSAQNIGSETNQIASSQEKEEVEQKYEPDKKEMSTTETGKPIIYQNEKYQFSLTLPSSWKGHYKVEEVHWNPSADVVIDFNFTYQGEVLSTLFSIHILSEELDEEAPLTYIASNDEKTFAYTKALEIPEAFYENEQLKAEQDQFLHMMNQDVPQIIESMQFES